MGEPITWRQRVEKLILALGREPTLRELVDLSRKHEMTPDEIEAQRQSWARANVATGDPRFD